MSRVSTFESNELPYMCSSEFRGNYEAEVLVPDHSQQGHNGNIRSSPPKQFVFPFVRIRVSSEQISIFDGPVREVFFSQWNTVTDIRHKSEPNTNNTTTMLMIFDEVKGLLIIRNKDPAAVTALLKAVHLFASVPDRDLQSRQQLGLPTTVPLSMSGGGDVLFGNNNNNNHHNGGSPGGRNNTQFNPHTGAAMLPSSSSSSPNNNLDVEHQMELERLRARTESMRRDISVGNLRSSTVNNGRRSESRATSATATTTLYGNNNNNNINNRSDSRQPNLGYLQDTDNSTIRRRQAAAARRSTSIPRSDISHSNNNNNNNNQPQNNNTNSYQTPRGGNLPPQHPSTARGDSSHHHHQNQQHHSPGNTTNNGRTPTQSQSRQQRSQSPMQEALSLYEEKLKKSEALAAKIQAEFQQDRMALRAATAADFSSSSATNFPSHQQNQTDVIVDELRLWMSTLDHAASESKRSLEKRGYTVRDPQPAPPLFVEATIAPLIQKQQQQQQNQPTPQFQSPPSSPPPTIQQQQQQQQIQQQIQQPPQPQQETAQHVHEFKRPPPLQIIESPTENNNNNVTPQHNFASPNSNVGSTNNGNTNNGDSIAANNANIAPTAASSREIKNTLPPPTKKTVVAPSGPNKSLAEMAAEAAAKRNQEKEAAANNNNNNNNASKNAAAEEEEEEKKKKEKQQREEADKKKRELDIQQQLQVQQKIEEEKRRAEEKKKEEEIKKKAEEQKKQADEAQKTLDLKQQQQEAAYARLQQQLQNQSGGGGGGPVAKPPPRVTNPPPPGSLPGTQNHSVADGTAKAAGTAIPKQPQIPVVAVAKLAPAPAPTPVANSNGNDDATQDPLTAVVVKDNWKRFYDKEKNQFVYENISNYERKYAPAGTSFAKLPVPELPAASNNNNNNNNNNTTSSDPTATVVKGEWQRIWAAAKGKYYYVHVPSNAKTWKASETSFADDEGAASTTATPTAAASLGPQVDDVTINLIKGPWQRIYVAEKGKCYYSNVETKAKTWKAVETSFADGIAGASRLDANGGAGAAVATATTQKSTTQDSQPAAAVATAPAASLDSADPTIPLVKGDWKRLWNAEKSKHYYLQLSTRKTTYKIAETSFADGTNGATEAGAASPTNNNTAATPSRSESSPLSSSSLAASDPTQPVSKGDWKRLWNAEKSKHYYLQISTRKTTYKVAETSFADGDEGAAAASPTAAAVASPTANSNNNNNNNAVAAASATPSGEEDPTQPAIRGIWKRMWAAEKNKHYYVNLETKERSWKADGTTFA